MMATETQFLGVDVGTSGAKAVLIDERGRVVATATHEYPLSTPRPLWAEQNPHDWRAAAFAAMREVVTQAQLPGEAVGAIGLTGQMHGLTLLDARGEVLRPAILWNDQRTGAECARITQRVGADRLIQWLGNPVLPGFTAPKIEWVRTHEPDCFARIAHVLLPKDYVRYTLTGEHHTDVADASGTALFDVSARTWSAAMLDALEIPVRWMPAVAESPTPTARLTASAAAELGLPPGVPVVAGAGDQAAQAVGTGIVAEGVASATLGTSGVVFAASDAYRVDPAGRLHAFCHAVPGRWHLMGVMLSAAGSLRWYRDALCTDEAAAARAAGKDPYDLLLRAAEDVSPGAEGLVFLPYLTGERTPHADPTARGAFIGLTLRHAKRHLTRAVLEGVAFGLCDSLELMRALGLTFDEVRISGGGARSPLWRQILADVFGCPMLSTNSTQGAAYGAALLAAVGGGAFADVPAAARAAVQVTGRTEPNAAAMPVYRELHARYAELYPALRASFEKLSRSAEGGMLSRYSA